MDDVRIGFIGAGAFANAMHYPSLAEMPDVRLTAVCDLDPSRAAATAAKYGIPYQYTDYRRMLDEQPLDAVYVVMPPMGLTPIVLECLAAGKPVFMEKPPGMTTEETRAMAKAAQRAGVFGMVGFNRRFADVLVRARERVLAKGHASLAVTEFHKNMLRERPYYEMSILRTDIIHAVDALRYFCGEAIEVHAVQDTVWTDWRNSYSALIRFQGGAVGMLTAYRAAGGRYERFELHGRGVSAYIRAPECAEVYVDEHNAPQVLTPASADPRLSYGYSAESRHFVDCVRSGRQPLTSLDDAVRTMELVDQIEGG
ncbi:MAG: Gfo/Idh/MocA family protein [Armatimonadota bacterium]